MTISPEILSAALVLLAVAVGLSYRAWSGKGHQVKSNVVVDLKKLAATAKGKPVTSFGKKATLLQFSAQYCAICPGVSRALGKIAEGQVGLKHLEVDITDRLDLAAHFSVNQTPTVFLLDSKGRIQYRFSGAPKLDVLTKELERYGIK